MPAPGRWYQHPFTVFLVPPITFLCLPQLYKFLPFTTNPSYDDSKLQKIASLMDDIYVTLANSTFIPHNAITRGPHNINTTAIKCKPSDSVLRLIELLPYVDLSLIQEPDWIYGGHFMDYRNPKHLAELCDPLRGQSIGWTDYMEPSDVALTNWGTGGWNNDATWVFIYNTERESIRIFEAELWVQRHQAKREFGREMEDWWFEESGEFEWDRHDGAPHVLRAIADNFKHVHWSPWGTSNREKGFGAPYAVIETLLKRNGWPDAFNSSQFNADLIRAKHQPNGKGYATAALKRIDELAGFNRSVADGEYTWIDSDKGLIAWTEEAALRERKAYETELDDEEHELKNYQYLGTTWLAEDYRAELEEARQEVARFCPDNVCVAEADMILWEHLALRGTQEEVQLSNSTQNCECDLQTQPSNDPHWLEKCIANKATERLWLDLAIEQSHEEALAHCSNTGCQLLPFSDVYARAHGKIAEYERKIERSVAYRERVKTDYLRDRPEVGAKAIAQMEKDQTDRRDLEAYFQGHVESVKKLIAELREGGGPEGGLKGLFKYLREEED